MSLLLPQHRQPHPLGSQSPQKTHASEDEPHPPQDLKFMDHLLQDPEDEDEALEGVQGKADGQSKYPLPLCVALTSRGDVLRGVIVLRQIA